MERISTAQERPFWLPARALWSVLLLLAIAAVFFFVRGVWHSDTPVMDPPPADVGESRGEAGANAGLFPILAVQGNGIAIQRGAAVSDLFAGTDFGRLNGASDPALGLRIFAIRNTGTAPLVLDDVSVPAGFVLASRPAGVVQPGGRTTFQVRLDMTAPGAHAGEIRIVSNDHAQSPFVFFIRGVVATTYFSVLGNGIDITHGDPIPDLDDHTDFGIVSEGSTLFTRVFTIQNDGDYPLALGSVAVPAGFILVTPPANTVAPGGTTSFRVRLHADTRDEPSGTIAFSHDGAAPNPFSFSIRATVVEPVPAILVLGNGIEIAAGTAIPDLVTGTDFGSISQTSSSLFSMSRVFTIWNQGGAPLLLHQIEVPQGFVVVSPPASRVGPELATTFQVQYVGTIPGIHAGEIRIHSNDSLRNPFVFAIQSTVLEPGQQPARINVFGNERSILNRSTNASVDDHTDFGSASRGGPPIVRTFVLRNTGDAPLQLDNVIVPEGFTVVGAPASTVVPGATTSLQVRLDTAIEGSKAGAIVFGHNAINLQPFSFWIQGEVTKAAPIAVVRGNGLVITNGAPSPPSLANHTVFGQVDRDSDPSLTVRVFEIRNEGSEPLILHAVQVSAGFTLVDSPASPVAPGGSTSFRVQLDTTSPGLKNGLVQITSNDEARNPLTFLISGSVRAPQQSSVPAPSITVFGNNRSIADGSTNPSLDAHTDFGSVGQGGMVARTFTIRNRGPIELILGAVSVPGGFTLILPPAGSLPAGGSTVFRVRIDTETVGERAGTIRIDGQDGQPLFIFSIRGVVTEPVATIAVFGNGADITAGDTTPTLADHTHFGSVAAGEANLRTFTIRNDGQTTLVLHAVSVSGDFILVQPPAETVAPGGTTSFQVRIESATAGSKSGAIRIESNDGMRNPFTFVLQGLVTVPPRL